MHGGNVCNVAKNNKIGHVAPFHHSGACQFHIVLLEVVFAMRPIEFWAQIYPLCTRSCPLSDFGPF
jgi:hypothetical protein